MTHLVKQAVGVFATPEAANRAYHRVVDRTVGCNGQTTAMHLDDFTTQVWTFSGGPPAPRTPTGSSRRPAPTGAASSPPGKRENVLLQAKVCQSGNGGPAVDVLAGAMQNTLGQ